VKPVLQALVLADRAYEDKASGKKIIAGTFGKLLFKRNVAVEGVGPSGEKVQKIPGGMHSGSPYAYINLTEVRGEVPISLRYVDLSQNEAIFQSELTIRCDDPLQNVELLVALPPLPTPHEGVFAFEVLYQGEPLGSQRVVVEELKG
jgi:hypothetical protein